jgi:hypothetical protein
MSRAVYETIDVPNPALNTGAFPFLMTLSSTILTYLLPK